MSVSRSDLEAWVNGYVKAWETNAPEDIGALFTEEALYYTAPFREPWTGRDGIVDGWLGRKDHPGEWEFSYEPLMATEELGIVRGWTRYRDPPSEYSNLWLIRLDDDGRCWQFTEWWMEHE